MGILLAFPTVGKKFLERKHRRSERYFLPGDFFFAKQLRLRTFWANTVLAIFKIGKKVDVNLVNMG